MKKTVMTVIIIIVTFSLTFLIYYVSSNMNKFKELFNDFHTTTMLATTKASTTKSTTTTTKYVQIDVDKVLENVKKEKGKVNIYFFYGKGCPHCEKEHKAFREIKQEYGDYYNLYEFEIWYNNTNRSLAHIFAKNMNTNLSGVPFTVIGEFYISGFDDDLKKLLINYIEQEKDKDFDVYFDKIKNS